MKQINKYEPLIIREREEIKLRLYKKFEKLYKKKKKDLDAQKLEHERNQYVIKNFYEELKKYKK